VAGDRPKRPPELDTQPGPDTQSLAGPGPAGSAGVERFSLRVTAGPDEGATFASRGERAVVGTHQGCDFVLADKTVSRFHCEIGPLPGDPGRIAIRDLDSRNGTWVDGVQIGQALLRSGATIAIGKDQLRFEAGGDRIQVPESARDRFGLLVGRSQAMRRVFAQLERAAESDATVLLEGETGTGKEVTAESIHLESGRRDGPLVVVDCGAIPSNLLESELFGHTKGAFTGAAAARRGAFAEADGGTIFLDEIGELGPDLQPKLLRVLERRQVKPVGGDAYGAVDVRVVAATNRNLRALVNQQSFRSDLYYRLAVVEIRLPALRERRDDLPVLVDHLLAQLDPGGEQRADLVGPELLAELGRHAWPGNVRELRNYLSRCLAMRERVPFEPAEAPGGAAVVDLSVPLKTAREQWVRPLEREYLEGILRRHDGNVSAAARAAGVDRATFYRLLWRHGMA